MFCKCTIGATHQIENMSNGLKKVGDKPFVGETPQDALDSWLTPNPLFYVRSHFEYPDISKADGLNWAISVDGGDGNANTVTMKDLIRMPKKTMAVTMECAGNNRSDLEPKVSGNQFDSGAISNAIWSGVSLSHVLDQVNLSTESVEILFEGADNGVPEKGYGESSYLRSLSLDIANDPDTILAYEMNGETLPVEHGFPLRLVVPGWYGMASVKWVKSITAIKEPFNGYFQGKKYVVRYQNGKEHPLSEMQVKSFVTSHKHGESISNGHISLSGLAWAGRAAVKSVQVSVDGGETWDNASLNGPSDTYSWQKWSLDWIPANLGHHTLIAKAIDSDDNEQPIESVWNELGYALNGLKPVCINII